MERARLPNRRLSVGFEFIHEYERGKPHLFRASVSFDASGAVQEVFMNGRKHDTAMDALARDLAIIVSVALQYGTPVAAMRKSVSRDTENYPASPIGMLLDKIEEISNATA